MFTSEFHAGSPSSALRGDVLGYTGYAEFSPVPFRRRELPGTEVHLILSLGPRITIEGHGVRTSFVAALDPAPAETVFEGEQLGVEAQLSPLATYRLLGGVPMDELSTVCVALDDLLDDADELAERLAGVGWADRFALLDDVLARRIDAGPQVPLELRWALGALARGTSAGDVARELGWSDRRLLRTFRRCVGVPPTVYARIVRFRRAVGLVGGAPLAEAALAAGYYDQAHMTRDFREFAGVTPGAYVGSVQDAA